MSIKQTLINEKILMKNGQTSFKAKDILSRHEKEVKEATSFLPEDAPLYQRWYHIRSESFSISFCQCCQKVEVTWIKSNNRYRKTCSKECHHLLKARNGGKSKKGDKARASYWLGRETILSKDPDGLKKLAQKGAATRKESGIDKIAAKKAGKTKSETICDNGLSIAQNSRYKQLERFRNEILPDGRTKQEAIADKISNVLLNSDKLKAFGKARGEFMKSFKPDGVNSYASLNSFKGAANCRITKEKRGSMVPKDQISAFDLYHREVSRITNFQELHLLENFEKRANHTYDKEAWHLDHKFSILQGFLKGISPYMIGNIANLEMLPWLDNIKKGSKCSITEEELRQKFL